MAVSSGIIGLPQSGRTTIFQVLTGGKEGAARVGVARIPEPRLKTLAGVIRPQRVVPATASYIDVGASVKGLVADKGIGGQLLSELSSVDALINVVRAFKDDSVPHAEGSLDINRDVANMALELTFSDLALLERRLERLAVSLKGAKPSERPGLLREQQLLVKLKTELENDIPLRELALSPEETRIIAGYQFLTAKPWLIVVNIGEEQLSEAGSLEEELSRRYFRPQCRVTTICGKLEAELAQLDEGAAREMYADFGITEGGVDRVIRLSYELLGLISFFSIASSEVKAWSIRQGTNAVAAAGKIHSDMARGFVRAEVISHGDLVRSGSLAEARKKGLLRLEGKDYLVRDGDVITFLFNV